MVTNLGFASWSSKDAAIILAGSSLWLACHFYDIITNLHSSFICSWTPHHDILRSTAFWTHWCLYALIPTSNFFLADPQSPSWAQSAPIHYIPYGEKPSLLRPALLNKQLNYLVWLQTNWLYHCTTLGPSLLVSADLLVLDTCHYRSFDSNVDHDCFSFLYWNSIRFCNI